jgi:hypothetical protein
MTVVVGVAVDGPAGRAGAYVGVEILEGSVTHLDAESAVPFIIYAVWVVASLKHVVPRFIFRGASHAVGRLTLCSLFLIVATTGLDAA